MSNGQLKAIVDRIMRVEDEIKALNADKSEIYKEAKGGGFDKKALRAVVRRIRALNDNSAAVEELDALTEIYLGEILGTAVDSGDELEHAHVRSHEAA